MTHSTPSPAAELAIPTGVYFSINTDNFYGPDADGTMRGKGTDFYLRWKPRWRDFPQSPSDLTRAEFTRQMMSGFSESTPELTPAMRRLIIAARVVIGDQSFEAIHELDAASEAFAEAVPWDDEPETPICDGGIAMTSMKPHVRAFAKRLRHAGYISKRNLIVATLTEKGRLSALEGDG